MSNIAEIWAWLGNLDPRIWQAIIAGGFLAVGWIYSGRQRLSSERRLRRIRRHDMQSALLAEIQHYKEALEFFDLDEAWNSVVLRMEAEPHYTPFIPSESNSTFFRACLDEITILPGAVIGPVTRYYNQVFAIDALIEDMRSAVYFKLDQPERIAVFTDYIAMKKEALKAADSAIDALAEQVGSAALNSRDAVPSDPR